MVKKKKLPIRWDRLAKENLDAVYAYIAEEYIIIVDISTQANTHPKIKGSSR